MKTTADWVRERPDTFLGSMEHEGQLEWIVGTADQVREVVDGARPVEGMDPREAARLRKQEVYLDLPPAAKTVAVVGRDAADADADAASESDPDGDGDGDGAGDGDGDGDGVVISGVEGGSEDEDLGGAGAAEAADTDDEDGPAKAKAKKKRAVGAPQKKAYAARVLVNVSNALVKIVDEVIQNAMDRTVKDKDVKCIQVHVDPARGYISVQNDGAPIPVTYPDPEENPAAPPGMLWPTILFTQAMSGSNFDQEEGVDHHQGGRNGLGAKATNICSTWFKVTVGDPERRLLFVQEWTRGMKATTGAHTEPYRLKAGFVKVEFMPDMAFFGFKAPEGGSGGSGGSGPVFPPELAAVFRTRVWEMAALTPERVAVKLDGVKLPVKNLTQFTSLFHVGATRPAHACGEHKGVTVVDLTVLPAGPCQPSDFIGFVNGVRCSKGKHRAWVFTQLAALLTPIVRRRVKGSVPDAAELEVRPSQVEAVAFVVLALRVNGPRFTSQTKDTLDTAPSHWGFKWTPDEAFGRRVVTLLADDIAAAIMAKTVTEAVKETNKKTAGGRGAVNIDKYEPAATAGKPGTNAFLLLAEGDSAKTMAMAGRAVTGSADVGVYCLKGKPLNPRNESITVTMANKVLQNLVKILGLKYGRNYEEDPEALKELRYRHLVMLADQDYDGGHIVGLIVNWIEFAWPSLLKVRPDFIKRFATPIVVARPKRGPGGAGGAGAGSGAVPFLSLPLFKRWLLEDPDRARRFKFQYYKGLGGHDASASREYFSRMDDHVVTLMFDADRDHPALVRFFDDREADSRKAMLRAFDPERCTDYSQTAVTVEDYLISEVLPYSNDHLQRNIPAMDGLTRTKRKLVFYFMTLPAGQLYKLQTVAMQAAAATGYHHGDASLYLTAVGLAQMHVFTNNINVLMCGGNMGDRLGKRSDFPAPRYISTGKDPIMDKLYRPEDACVLVYRVEDGDHQVEPVVFAPVVPVDLLNGCSGVATGWRTEIPAFHPGELAAVLRARALGDPGWRAAADAMLPWYDGFTGPIEATPKAWVTRGLYHLVEGDTTTSIVISELPVGTWKHPYEKAVLSKLLVGQPGGFVLRICSDSTDTRISITLVCDSDLLAAAIGSAREEPFQPDPRAFLNSADDTVLGQAAEVYRKQNLRYPALEKLLRLESSIPSTLIYRFDAKGVIQRYRTVADVLDAFAEFRLGAYAERLAYQAGAAERDIAVLENKVRFATELGDGTMAPGAYQSQTQWWQDLAARGYLHDTDPRIAKPPPRIQADLPMAGPVAGAGAGDRGAAGAGEAPAPEGEEEEPSAEADAPAGTVTFKYLTDRKVSQFTAGTLRRDEAMLAAARARLDLLRSQTPQETWARELDEFAAAYEVFMKKRQASNKIEGGGPRSAAAKGKAGKARAGAGGPTKRVRRPAPAV